ncbi:NAD(P)-dependent oxidoreductase [Microbacterium sp. PRC9]|uniref:NAD(P)-dependent oxidoreductase n=1 Tax=Microbacterium sp. PRC9 TaxID=2962591 RepID=UPI002881EEFA|nr:NAD(P)-dependent oxidoreductase [Microbacterium sp. PRC9]MDT0144519.1 NAD(P)-dependent oxidoreductase [Microbacterium sp. PRC9]
MSAPARILVTPRSLTADDGVSRHPSLAPLRAHGFELVAGPPGRLPRPDELPELLDGAVGWLAGVERISADVLSSAGSLRVIARNGTGADSIDLEAATGLGIRVITAPGANAQGVAELALALALASVRDIVAADRTMKAGGWTRTSARELSELRVGVAGYGAIGRRVATLFAAVGAEVRIYDPWALEPVAHRRVGSLEELAETSDVLSLHAPPPADGSALVTAHLLERVPPGAILINTARSALVDADAVARALDDGRLGAYAVDAFDTEPPVLDRLLRHERTIMTPHIGGFTAASVQRATDAAVAALVTALAS